jgi:hypothetical protein
MHYRLAFSLIAGGLSAHRLVGQGAVIPVPIDSGTLVRMIPLTGPPIEGRLVRRFPAVGSTLYACRYPGPPCHDPADSTAIRRVQLSSLLRVDVQRGSHLGSGAIIGGIIGAVLFDVYSSFVHAFCDAADCGPSTTTLTIRGALAGTILGMLFGGASPNWGPPK